VKEKLSIAIMAVVGNSYYAKESPCNAQQLTTRLGISAEACNKVINALLDAKLLIKTGGDPPALTPGYALEVMLLKDVVNAVRTSGESASLNPLALMSTANVQQAYERLEDGVQYSLRNLTVKDLLDIGAEGSNESTGDTSKNATESGNSDEMNVHKLSKP
jgi:DNA-binding IscR family transcriptional regulator